MTKKNKILIGLGILLISLTSLIVVKVYNKNKVVGYNGIQTVPYRMVNNTVLVPATTTEWQGDIIPSYNNTWNFGSLLKNWKQLFVNTITAVNSSFSSTLTGDYNFSVNTNSTSSLATPNSGYVVASPYTDVCQPIAGGGNYGAPTGVGLTYREFFMAGQQQRIRQTGYVRQVKFYTADLTNYTGIYVKFWRNMGTYYSMVGKTPNLISQVSADTMNTLTLDTPIAVQTGDFYSIKVEATDMSVQKYILKTNTACGSGFAIKFTSNPVDPGDTNYTWGSVPNTNNYGGIIQINMDSPNLVSIGDSRTANHPQWYSFVEATTTIYDAYNTSYDYYVASSNGWTVQNMGIGSQTSSDIKNRFTTDVVNLKPKVAIIEPQVNDISGGSITMSTFLSNYSTMLTACRANGIKCIVLINQPWTNGTNAQMITGDTWNENLKNLVLGSYSDTAMVVDIGKYIGQFRTGGSIGNTWDIKTAYNADGVHYTATGNAQISAAINAELAKASLSVDNINSYANDSLSFTSFVNNVENAAAYLFDTKNLLSGTNSFLLKLSNAGLPLFGVDSSGIVYSNGLIINSGLVKIPVSTFNASSYELTSTDYIIQDNYTTTNSSSVNLKTAQMTKGRKVCVVDGVGGASGKNITIYTEGTEKISGADTVAISTAYGSKCFYTDGSNWFTISSL